MSAFFLSSDRDSAKQEPILSGWGLVLIIAAVVGVAMFTAPNGSIASAAMRGAAPVER